MSGSRSLGPFPDHRGRRTVRFRRLNAAEVASYAMLAPDLSTRVRLVRIPRLPGPYVGMTLGHHVLLATDVPADGRNLLLAHELIHVRQWAELGVIGFLGRYLAGFARGLWRHRSWQRAYYNIGLEREAREGAEMWSQRLRL